MRKKITNTFITLFLIGIIVFCVYQIYIQLEEYKVGETIYDDVESLAIVKDEKDTETTKEGTDFLVPEYESDDHYLNLDWDALEKLNPDIIGWIYCPGTELNYPILKSKDNEDYIHTTVTGAKNSAGSIFLDYRNSPLFLDYNSILYGHNMKNGSMFKTVNRYKNETWYHEHPIIHIYTKYSAKRYCIISVLNTTSDSEAYTIKFNEQLDYANFLDKCVKNSIYNTKANYSYNKNTITLSTCNGSVGGNKRVVVMLQSMEDEDNEVKEPKAF